MKKVCSTATVPKRGPPSKWSSPGVGLSHWGPLFLGWFDMCELAAIDAVETFFERTTDIGNPLSWHDFIVIYLFMDVFVCM